VRAWLCPWIVGLLLCAATAPGATPERLQLPPLVQPPSGEQHPGKIIWLDLATPDLASAERFYGELFGWTFQHVPSARSAYSIALLNGTAVAGIVQPRVSGGQHRQPNWLPFIATADLAAVERQVVGHGGKLLAPPEDYPDRGRQAVFADPKGAVFGVLQSSSGDPPDVMAEPGEWIWYSLLTSNPSVDATFYQRLFGYEIDELPSEDAAQHLLLATQGYARAGVNVLPPDSSKSYPYWLCFLRVVSATDTVRKAKSLGALVLVEAHPDRDGDTVAVLADPAGAPFGVLEWANAPAPDSSAPEPK
jgi:uncharacterized protein